MRYRDWVLPAVILVLVFGAFDGHDNEIYRYADGELLQLTDDPSDDWDPAFTTDGKEVVVSVGLPARNNLPDRRVYAITPAGEHVTIDPMICAGCGACAAACPSPARRWTKTV